MNIFFKKKLKIGQPLALPSFGTGGTVLLEYWRSRDVKLPRCGEFLLCGVAFPCNGDGSGSFCIRADGWIPSAPEKGTYGTACTGHGHEQYNDPKSTCSRELSACCTCGYIYFEYCLLQRASPMRRATQIPLMANRTARPLICSSLDD